MCILCMCVGVHVCVCLCEFVCGVVPFLIVCLYVRACLSILELIEFGCSLSVLVCVSCACVYVCLCVSMLCLFVSVHFNIKFQYLLNVKLINLLNTIMH